MSTDIEQELRGAMERFTGGVRIPPGLAVKAYRQQQKRRGTTRAVAAAGTAAIVAGGVAVAGAAGAFGSASPSPAQATYTAYVVNHVERALTAPSQAKLVQSVRTTFPAGTAVQPTGVASMQVWSRPGSPWQAGLLQDLRYHGRGRVSAFTASGRRVFDLGTTLSYSSLASTTVDYLNRTWWPAGISGLPPRPGPGPEASCGPQIEMRVGTGWAEFIQIQLKCGEFTVAGREQVDGVNAIKIVSKQGTDTFWVSPESYLPVRLITSLGGVRQRSDFQWLAPTPANLAPLEVAAPAGFKQVPPPWQKATTG
jgi:hypothetical protein